MKLYETIEFIEELSEKEYANLGFGERTEIADLDSGEEVYRFMKKKGTLDYYGGILREKRRF